MSRAAAVAVQLGVVWAVGAVGLPWAVGAMVMLLLGSGGAAAVYPFVVGGLLIAALWAVVRATSQVTRLGGSGPGRVVWALLVGVVGAALWALGWAVADEAGLGVSGSPVLATVLSGVPFLLVAAMLLRGWQLNASAVLALLGVTAYGAVALRDSGPDELTLRLRHAGLDRATALVTEIPGYLPTEPRYGGRAGSGTFLPENPAAVPAERYVTIVAYRVLVPGMSGCGPTAQDSHLYLAVCSAEPGGLLYRRGATQHGYQVRKGAFTVEVVGTLAVDRKVLRGAVATLRLAKPPEGGTGNPAEAIFEADVPGYRGQPTGVPPGTIYSTADHTGGAGRVAIAMRADRINADGVCWEAECVQDGGMTYFRRADEHGYLQRRGDVDLIVSGGISIDRAVLREAIQTVRPATDQELMHALPPPPPGSVLDRLRTWLRS
jgi:hypothetical protein